MFECISLWVVKTDGKEGLKMMHRRKKKIDLEPIYSAGKPVRALVRVLPGLQHRLQPSLRGETKPPAGFILPLSQFNGESE